MSLIHLLQHRLDWLKGAALRRLMASGARLSSTLREPHEVEVPLAGSTAIELVEPVSRHDSGQNDEMGRQEKKHGQSDHLSHGKRCCSRWGLQVLRESSLRLNSLR